MWQTGPGRTSGTPDALLRPSRTPVYSERITQYEREGTTYSLAPLSLFVLGRESVLHVLRALHPGL